MKCSIFLSRGSSTRMNRGGSFVAIMGDRKISTLLLDDSAGYFANPYSRFCQFSNSLQSEGILPSCCFTYCAKVLEKPQATCPAKSLLSPPHQIQEQTPISAKMQNAIVLIVLFILLHNVGGEGREFTSVPLHHLVRLLCQFRTSNPVQYRTSALDPPESLC